MRTTVRLNDALLAKAKREAVRRQTTVTALIEEGLRSVLSSPLRTSEVAELPVSTARGGPWPGIDIHNSAQLVDILEGTDDPGRRERPY